MTLHLLKLAVGIDSVTHLRDVQAHRRGTAATVGHVTRHAPKRAAALLDGGSMYWVIRGVIRVRQRLVGIEPDAGPGGSDDDRAPARRGCRLILDPALVLTLPRAQRAFQGWRYLRADDAPADVDAGEEREAEAGGELPAAMVAELAKLGLL